MASACDAMLGTVIEGESVGRISRFFDEDGLPWNPPSIDVTFVSPLGVVTHPVPAQLDVGVYRTIFTPTEDGFWVYQIAPVGGLNQIDQGRIRVARSLVP